MLENLRAKVKEKKVVLFVGSGVSNNLALPTFSGLADMIGAEMGYDPDIFNGFGSYMALAEYYKIKYGSIGKIRSWMDRAWHSESVDIKRSGIHNAICALNCPIIYTTNYDRWLEKSYEANDRKFVKITGAADMAKSNMGTPQIVKFHGDFDSDDTIVLTESSYFDRMTFEGPLDTKLRHDAISNSLLFVGYSLADINMRYLLYRLNKLWDTSSGSKERTRAYIFLSRPNPVEEAILESRGITPFVSDLDSPGIALEKFLSDLVVS